MVNLQNLVAHQQAQIQALKKKARGESLDASEELIIDLTISGKSPVQTQQRASDKIIIDLATGGKAKQG
jgi:hypothetical protein